LLLFYALLNELKLIAMALNIYHGSMTYYLATFVQIFFGILFSFITETKKNIPIFSKHS